MLKQHAMLVHMSAFLPTPFPAAGKWRAATAVAKQAGNGAGCGQAGYFYGLRPDSAQGVVIRRAAAGEPHLVLEARV